MTTRIYLSAPITGHDLTERKAYFRRMADRLLQLYPGAEIVSPLDDIDTFISDTRKRQGCNPTHAQYMRRDLLLLLSCDVICLGHGHHASTPIVLPDVRDLRFFDNDDLEQKQLNK